MNIVPVKTSAHWYSREGHPTHTVIGSNGAERDTSLRDARKLGLFPSVTSILNVIAKPGLDSWIVSQGILAALTLPKNEGEPLDAFARRVVVDMDGQRDKAAVTGRRIHAAIDQLLSGMMPDPEMSPYLVSVGKWFDEIGLKPDLIEADMVSLEWGYGGRIDLYADIAGRPALVDFKSQDIKKDKPNFYESWPLQLAAYRQTLHEAGKPVHACYSVVVDTKKGCPIHVREWTAEELEFDAFAGAFTLWKYLKKYNPLEQSHDT